MPGDQPPESPEAGTARSFGMLLGPGDLPGDGWATVEERSWPTGGLDTSSEKSRRALAAGGITAWRKFGQTPATTTVWVEVVPYASNQDAVESLGQVPRFFTGASQPAETVVAGHVVDDRAVPGVGRAWVYEKASTVPEGYVVSRYVAGVVGPILVITCVAGTEERWAWDEVIGLAGGQIARARQALAG